MKSRYKIGQWVKCVDDCGQDYCGKIIDINNSGFYHIDLGPNKTKHHWIPDANQKYGYGVERLFTNKERRNAIKNYKGMIISLNQRIEWLSK